MTNAAMFALVALIALCVSCSPPCLDVSSLPVLPVGDLSKRVSSKVESLKTVLERAEVTNTFTLPPLFLPEFVVKLNQSNSILVTKRQAKNISRLYEISGTNILRQLPNPADGGSVQQLVVASTDPLILLAEVFRDGPERSRYETWIYNAKDQSRRKISEDSYGGAVSPDGRRVAWKKGFIGWRDVEVMDLQTDKATVVFSVCGDGSQVPSPTLIWMDSTNLVANGTLQNLWSETLVYDAAAKKLWRTQ